MYKLDPNIKDLNKVLNIILNIKLILLNLLIHFNCYNKHYVIYFYRDHIKIKINLIPEDEFNKNKLYYDLIILKFYF